MAQPNLLQRAKQGNADAIAALMNLTLQDKGVAATVVRIQDYLHISFSAANSLNQATLMEFTRRGLERLEVKSIQTVKVYGLKAHQEQPNWVATFQLGSAASSKVRSPIRSPFQFDRARLKPWQDRVSSLLASAQPVLQSLQQTALAAPAKVQALLSSARSRLRSPKLTLPTPQEILPPGINLTVSLAIVSGVTVAAFLVGGMVAGIAISHGEKASKPSDRRTANSPANALSAPAGQPQAQVKQYLIKMIETQKLFYQQNLRLAKNLEELERAAAVVSHSYSYTYRVSTATPTQFQLVAIAKTPDLKSYTAIAIVKSIAEAPIATGLCETNQPTQVPPIVSLNPANKFQCPAGSSKVQ